jgi:hypothetical protein
MSETKRATTLVEKLLNGLIKGGLSERKAREIAKILAPTARAAVKAELKAKNLTIVELAEPQPEAVDKTPSTEASSPAKAIPGSVLPYTGAVAADLLQRMHGLTSNNSYVVAAVKGDKGIISVRKFNEDSFKLKFYPDMEFWETSFGRLQLFGATDYLKHSNHYERAMFTKKGMESVINRVNGDAALRPNKRGLLNRMATATLRALVNAFKA